MTRRIAYRLGIAGIIVYAAACSIPLSMLVRAVGYAQSAPYKRLLPAWQMASWLFLALGAVALAGSLACFAAARRHNLFYPHRVIAATWLAIAGTVVSMSVIQWMDGVKDALFYSPARTSSCLSNEKQLGNAMSMYSQDYDGHFPLANTWNQTTEPYIRNEWVYCCPEDNSRTPIPSYGYLTLLAGAWTEQVTSPASTVILFDSRPGANVSGGIESLASPPRHKVVTPDGPTGANIGFADGHAKFTPMAVIPALEWTPQFEPPSSSNPSHRTP